MAGIIYIPSWMLFLQYDFDTLSSGGRVDVLSPKTSPKTKQALVIASTNRIQWKWQWLSRLEHKNIATSTVLLDPSYWGSKQILSIANTQSPYGEDLEPPTNSQHQMTRHVYESFWKGAPQPLSSLQMTIAPANIRLQLYDRLKWKLSIWSYSK